MAHTVILAMVPLSWPNRTGPGVRISSCGVGWMFSGLLSSGLVGVRACPQDAASTTRTQHHPGPVIDAKAGSYGRGKTVYNRHRCWSADGTWAWVLAELRRGADTHEGPGWTVGLDLRVVRAHRHRAGAPRDRPRDLAGSAATSASADTRARVA